MPETILTNAVIVLPDQVVHGTLVIRDGAVAEVSDGRTPRGEDMEGDTLIPGLVELHTDHLENHYAPRPRVRWNPLASVQAHDAQVAASGITTVFDTLRVGTEPDSDMTGEDMRHLADAIEQGMAEDRLRADHFIHLRCEVPMANALDMFALFEGDPRVRMASLMDHTPGQRQFASLDHMRAFYQGPSGLSDPEFDAMVERRLGQAETYSAGHRAEIAARCRARGIPLASHDDATAAHVAESVGYGVTVAEFPTTFEAAEAARAAGLAILMGAPNVVRGGSHTGNVAAQALLDRGLLDVLSSDYVPFSLLHAVFLLAGKEDGIGLPQAVATVTRNPAAAAGLDDRGELVPGRRADLVRVRVDHEVPLVRSVWRQGKRVS
jgi:alpha-D-ribose 1-methylphosphonate 5-triphosphate diphosphatase